MCKSSILLPSFVELQQVGNGNESRLEHFSDALTVRSVWFTEHTDLMIAGGLDE